MDVLIVFGLAAVVLALMSRAARAAGAAARSEPVAGDVADASARGQALWKINQAIQMFQQNLDSTKLRHGNDAYVGFYLAYVHALAQAFADDEGVAFDAILRTPVMLEVLRLTDAADGSGSAQLLAELEATPAGRLGAEAGRADGWEACDPDGNGPYFQRLRSFFETADAPGRSDGG